MKQPKVSFLIPIYNDEKHVGKTIKSIFSQDYDGVIEIVFADGNSEDKSREIIKEFQKNAPKNRIIKIYDNPARNTAVGRNICLKQSTGKYIFNYSSHAYAAKNYVKTLVASLEKSKAMAVGACSNPIDKDMPFISQCINYVFSTFLGGLGGTDQNIQGGKEREAKSVAFTAYKREVFDKIGNFDEQLWVGQDGELNIRLRKAGYTLLFNPKTYTRQQKRDSVKSFWRQMFRYGLGAALRIKKHPDSFRVIYLVPSLGVLALPALLLTGFMLWIVHGWAYLVLSILGLFLLYVFACILSALGASKSMKIALCSPLFYMIIHFGYGLGFLKGLKTDGF